MASFKDQVEDLVGVSISDTDGLDAMLQGSTREICKVLPEVERVKMATITDDVTSTVDKEIFSVSRSGYYATEIGRGLAAQAADTNSIYSATNETPVYYVSDKVVTVLPASGTVQILSFTTPAVANGWGTSELIGSGLPSSIEYAITLGASMGQIHSLLAVKRVAIPSAVSISDLSISSVAPADPSPALSSVVGSLGTVPTYTKPTMVLQTAPTISDLSVTSVAPVVPTLTSQSVDDFSSVAPTYLKPTRISSTAFTDYTSGLNELDPGIFSIGAVAPTLPSLTQVVFTSVDTSSDIVAPVISTATIETANIYTGNPPNYTKPAFVAPVLGTVGDLTLPVVPNAPSVSAQSVTITGTAPSYTGPVISPNFTKVDTYIDTDEDVELAVAKIDEIRTQLQEFQAKVQDSVNEFNEDNALFQATLQKDIQDAQFNDANEARKLEKYQSEVQSYVGEVTANVQKWTNEEWAQNFQKYQNDFGGFVQIYQRDIQNELNEFNKENVVYQSAVQESMQKFQSDNGINLAQAQSDLATATSSKDRDLQKQLQNKVNDMQAIISDNSRKVELYQAEIQTYQANIGKDVQTYSGKMSQYQLELNTSFQAWGKTESDNLAVYQADIQNELNNFQKESAIYQATMQEKIQEAQLKDANEGRKLQKYQAELQEYQNNVSKEVQEYTTNLGQLLQEYAANIQRQQVEIETLKVQYTWVSVQYQQQLQILAGVPRQGVPTQND